MMSSSLLGTNDISHSKRIKHTTSTSQSFVSDVRICPTLPDVPVFQSLPTAVIDVVSKYAQYHLVKGQFMSAFSIGTDERIVPYYYYVGNEHTNAVDYTETGLITQKSNQNSTVDDTETGLITQKSNQNSTVYTIYNLTGEAVRRIFTGPLSLFPSLSRFIPEYNDSCEYTLFNSEFGCVWNLSQWDPFNVLLFGENRKVFTHWINKTHHVIHDWDTFDYPLQFPSWVSRVCYDTICVTNEFLYLVCKIRDQTSDLSTELFTFPYENELSRLCLFTLKGHFVQFIYEFDCKVDIKDFIVTKDQQVFVLTVWSRLSLKLVKLCSSSSTGIPSSSTGIVSHETIDINGRGKEGCSLCLLKSGHLAIELDDSLHYDDDHNFYEDQIRDIQIFG